MATVIWVVDDESVVAQWVGEVLEKHGYETRWLVGGQEYMDAFKEGPLPAVVILDIKMPPPDGNDVLEFMRDKVYPPVVILSGYPGMVREELRDVARAVITKPPDYLGLLNVIAALVPDPPVAARGIGT